MKNLTRTLALGGLLALAAGAASADVTVNYVQPERFSDLPFTPWDREAVLKELTEHFASLGAQLPPGQNLRVDVLDVDLAGREVPGRSRDLRIVKDIDWPRIDLRFVIEQNGQVLRSGEAHLRDMTFLDRARFTDRETLTYEKHMIDQWFYSEILPRDRAARR